MKEAVQPTQGGDKGEAVGWLGIDSMGRKILLLSELVADDHIDECGGTKTPLYAAPQPASNAYTAQESQIDLLAKCIAGAELNYRNSYQINGAGHIETGRMWDKMRRAGDAIRQYFYEREEASSAPSTLLCTPSPLKEATAAQHFDLPKGEPARFVRDGVLETCRCRDCQTHKGIR